MGAEPWDYFVPYEPDVRLALARLRRQEMQAGRYRWHPESEEAESEGTASILDIERVSDTPDFGAAAPLSDTELREFFGTIQPTREMIEGNLDFYENIERGHGVYIIAYKNGKPDEIFFGGYSYD
jgi:hypothetical protein